MADVQVNGASSNPLGWISQAMKSKLAALGADVRSRAEAIYVRTVAEECKIRPLHDMKKARRLAKARKKAIQKNTIYDEDGNETGQGAGGYADELMQVSIEQAKNPPKKRQAVVGGRRRRTRRSRRRRRRTRRRRNKRKSKSRKRRRRRRRGGGGSCKTAYDDSRPYRCIRCDQKVGIPRDKGICIGPRMCVDGTESHDALNTPPPPGSGCLGGAPVRRMRPPSPPREVKRGASPIGGLLHAVRNK